MKLLQYSDWKQRIAFDNIVYKDVKRYSLALNTREREIMEIQIDFYRSHFSILQVMKHFTILKTPEEKETFIKAVLKRVDKILYIPNSLSTYFRNKIKSEYQDYSSFFNLLLDKGLNQSKKNPTFELYKAILGSYYKPALRRINKCRKRIEIPIMQKTLKPEAIANTAMINIQNLQNDLYMSKIYGRSSIRKTVPISVVDEYGYGEWVSKKVSYNTDRFFIYSNNNTITDNQLEHMVYFNVYPGYGHFYNTVVNQDKNISFDNGATFLINGWAMYAMCHSKSSAYSSNMMTEGAIIAHNLLKNNLEKAFEDTYIYLLGKYSKDKAINYMLDYSQYPAHYLSYILGSLAIELCIEEGFANNPIDFLQTMSKINCGDFFALYTPKMQSKIALESITARVSPKFNKK